MVNRSISKDSKECALSLWDSGWDLEDICDALGVSKSSCYRWRRIFEEHGDVNQSVSPLVGRPRKITRAILGAIEELYTETSDLSLEEVCTWLAVEHRVEVSISTLSRNLNDAGLTRATLQNLASERNLQDRAQCEEFRQALHDFVGDGSEFIIVGETCNLDDRTHARRFGRTSQDERGQNPVQGVFFRGARYSLCAALTKDGYYAFDVTEGLCDIDKFYNFIVQDVLRNMNPFPQERSVMVLDNCRIRHDRLQDLTELVESAGCLLLLHPPYSPDLTPIEESFSTFKAYIHHHSHELHECDYPYHALLEAAACVTKKKAQGWLKNAGYIFAE